MRKKATRARSRNPSNVLNAHTERLARLIAIAATRLDEANVLLDQIADSTTSDVYLMAEKYPSSLPSFDEIAPALRHLSSSIERKGLPAG